IKFTPEGGRVSLKAEADCGYLVLTVTDTGVGIAPEEQDLVFQKFRQSGNPLTREHTGTGLGLSIVRELAKLLGGEIVLQAEPGLEQSVQFLKGVGPARAEALARLAINSVGDLIFHFPRSYDDLTDIRPMDELSAGSLQTVRGEIVEMESKERPDGRQILSIV